MASTSYSNETKLQLLRRIATMERSIEDLQNERNVQETQEEAPVIPPSEVLCDFWKDSRSCDRLDLCRDIVRGLGHYDATCLARDILSIL